MELVKSSKIKLIFLAIILLILFTMFNRNNTGIFDYNPKTDREFILNIFAKNWYWLVSENSVDFSAEYMLDNKASSRDRTQDLNIKVYYEKDQPIGFVAYFMLASHYGRILFIAIEDKYRGKGYSKKLINYAIEDLRKKKASIITLTIRTNKKAARALYTSIGFKETRDDGKFIDYKISNN